MRAFLIQILAVIATATLVAVEPSPQSAVDAAKSQLTKIKLGMTRKEVERILGPAWEEGVVAGWASRQDARYRNKALPDYYLEIHFDWTGQRGIGRFSKPEDPVIRLPEIKPYEPRPKK